MTDIFDISDVSDLPAEVRKDFERCKRRTRTNPRRKYETLLKKAGRPLSATELFVGVWREFGSGPARLNYIYGSLKTCISRGLIVRLPDGRFALPDQDA